ncbi:MAG TPA: cytochrome c [Rhizomicrobium sp.]|nr:cytochrome c [Rhizomicrobium sp.]
MFLVRRPTLIRAAVALLAMFGATQQAKADNTAPRSQSVLEVTEGGRIARTLCVNCHMVDASGPATGSDRLLSFSWIANQKGLTSTTLPAWLSTSHQRMPDFNLTRDEIRQVSAYILSLRK